MVLQKKTLNHDLQSIFRQRRLAFVWLVCITIFFLFDIIIETYQEGLTGHVLIEAVILSSATWFLFVEIRGSMRARKRLHEEQQLLHKEQERLQSARQKVDKLSGELSQFISEQFVRWQLTKSETDVAWMMLKGLSFPEIAKFRTVKEKTVRQQAVSIYAKSQTKNRMGFVAYFFEELLGKDVSFATNGKSSF